jgi:hypothetical protein
MRIKMGTSVPKMGTDVHLDADQAAYREAIADALRRELGASERTAKYWLSGERGPSGEHLIRLAQHSDAVLITTLTMAGRLSEQPRHRCPSCPERLLIIQNLRQDDPKSEGSSQP